MKYWSLGARIGNPPYPLGISGKLQYLRTFARDSAYIPGQGETESKRAYKLRIYETLRALSIAETPQQKMRVETIWPNADWRQIWDKLMQATTSEADKAEWYKVVHDVIPTNERLHRIKITSTALCGDCGTRDTLLHRLTECGERLPNWSWLRGIIARMLRTSSTRIPREWIVRPQFNLWPPQRHRATKWIIARYVAFSMNRRRSQTLNDLMDFLRRSPWKLYQKPERQRLVANFLTVLG